MGLLLKRFGGAPLFTLTLMACQHSPSSPSLGRKVDGHVNSGAEVVAGATVSARRILGDRLLAQGQTATTTDRAGQFSLELAAGEYLIEARDESHAPAAAIVHAQAAGQIELTMPPGGSIRGRVLDRHGSPTLGSTVSVEGQLPLGSVVADRWSVTAQTSESGQFELRGLRPGILRLVAHHPRFHDSAAAVVPLVLAGRVDNIELVADPGTELSGTIVDEASRPLERAIVDAVDSFTGSIFTAAPSTPDGHFTIAGLYPGTFLLEPRQMGVPPRRAAARVTIKDHDVDGLVLGAHRTFTIEGTLDRGPGIVKLEPLVDGETNAAQSTIDRRTAEVDPQGHFGFSGVRLGKASLRAEGPLGTCYETTIDVTGDVRGITVAPRRRASIVGFVRGSNGGGVANARVELVSATLSAQGWRDLPVMKGPDAQREVTRAASQHIQTRSISTSADGRFEATCLEPGPFELTAYLDNRQLAWKDPAAHGGPRTPLTVDAREGESPSVDLEMQSCTGGIVGTVLDEHGEPSSGAWVSAIALAGTADPVPAAAASTGNSGQYHFAGLCEGRYRVVARALDGLHVGAAPAVDASAGQIENVRLRLNDLAAFRGAVKAEQAVVSSFGILLRGPDERTQHFESKDGTFSEPLLIPGTYDALVEADNGYTEKRVSVETGQLETTLLQLAPWSSISGIVVDQRGAPLDNLPIRLLFEGRDKMGGVEQEWPSRERLREARTDASGHFQVERAFARRTRLTFGAPGAELLVASTSNRGGSMTTTAYPRLDVVVTPDPGTTLDLGNIVVEGRR